MDFIKSLRSSGPSHTSVNNVSRFNSTRIHPARVPQEKKPSLSKPTFKDRFMDIKTKQAPNSKSTNDRMKLHREETRRNQRLNLINNCRLKNTDPIDCQDTHNESNLQSTFIMPPNLSPRKNKLEQWRQQKKQREENKKTENKPVFKVTHVDQRKIFEVPNKKMPKSYSFNGKQTWQTSYRQNSTLLSSKPEKKEVQYFGNQMDVYSSQFTFEATVPRLSFKEYRKMVPTCEEITPFVHKDEKLEAIVSPDFEEMMKDLKPEERAFLNETMEGRNRIITSSANLSCMIDNDRVPTTQKPSQEVKTQIHINGEYVVSTKTSQNKEIETITNKIDQTLTITNSITPIATEITNSMTPTATEITNSITPIATGVKHETQDIKTLITIMPIKETPEIPTPTVTLKAPEKFTTPVKNSVKEGGCDTPVLVINKNEIISPIKTELENKIDTNANVNAKEAIIYYRQLVKDKTSLLNDLANRWESICNERVEPPISEDNQGDIRCACGLANLLVDERFSQFKELVDKCEDTNSKDLKKELESKLVLASDLQGFWDMIYHQVVDVEKRFFNLDKLRKNNWVEIIELPIARVKADPNKFKAKINPLKKKGSVDVADKESDKPKIKSARSKFAEFKAKMKKNTNTNDIPIEIVIETKAPVVAEPPKKQILEPIMKPKVIEEIPKALIPKSRKSIKPEISMDNIIDSQPENKEKKYSLRTRRSDLIKWDSPSQKASPRRTVTKGIFTLPTCNSTIVEASETEPVKTATPICFDFDDDYEPILFNKAAVKHSESVPSNKENQVTNKFNVGRQQTNILNSPKTPQNMRKREVNCNSAELPKTPSVMKNISNSPLLKLAMISSHGKRQSMSTGKNMRTNFQINDSDNALF